MAEPATTSKKEQPVSAPVASPPKYTPLRGTDNTVHNLSTIVQAIHRQYKYIRLYKGDKSSIIFHAKGAEEEGTWEEHYRYAVSCLALALLAGRGTMKDGAILWLQEHQHLFAFMNDITVELDPKSRGGAEKYYGTWGELLNTVLAMAVWVKKSVEKYPLAQKEGLVSKPKEGKVYIDPTTW